ncbi:HAMP domain-containing histidine kinase [Flavobacterium jejuense]|uniref:histidine kinase n=1 Tax=Flavobacterium jejuense TaxID=1544455 RepID=A0ABX0IN11_9FLAO|nr:HAMP domain-containing sensor histidine kinase [Flavobacterium jejuense]NHN24981.1 HAMP domain-containing histidine kinase [Flavobacterium jejuense]
MKLINKTSRYYILLTLPVLLASALFCYWFMLHELGESSESLLISRVKVIENHLIKGDSLILAVFQENNELYIKEIDTNVTIPQKITDTLIYSKIQKEYISNKILQKSIQIDTKNYFIKVWKSSLEFDEILEIIFYVFISILVLLLLTIVYINIRISKIIWAPFFHTVSSIKNFKVSDKNALQFQDTSISEFQELNKSIEMMTEKMVLDYSNQKKFTENASHEFQTPLAIIKSKVDLLLQSKNINENEMKLLASIDDTANRLSKINKSLLLLSKIENGQFENNKKIDIRPIIDKIIFQKEDLILSKNIFIENTIESNFSLLLNEELAYILLSNLIQNAIRHNLTNGKIILTTRGETLVISNTSIEKELDQSLIFERFVKKSNDQKSLGLGLSLVKEIADLNTIAIEYSYTNELHFFKLTQKNRIQIDS